MNSNNQQAVLNGREIRLREGLGSLIKDVLGDNLVARHDALKTKFSDLFDSVLHGMLDAGDIRIAGPGLLVLKEDLPKVVSIIGALNNPEADTGPVPDGAGALGSAAGSAPSESPDCRGEKCLGCEKHATAEEDPHVTLAELLHRALNDPSVRVRVIRL